MLSIDDLTLTGDDKIKADLHGKNWRIYEEEKQKEQGEESSRELSESFNRQSQQLHFYSEMRISEQVEAMRRFKTKQSIEQTKPTTKPKNEQRDDDFTQWINESKPDLEAKPREPYEPDPEPFLSEPLNLETPMSAPATMAPLSDVPALKLASLVAAFELLPLVLTLGASPTKELKATLDLNS